MGLDVPANRMLQQTTEHFEREKPHGTLTESSNTTAEATTGPVLYDLGS